MATTAPAASTALEQLVETERMRFGVPGVAVAVVRGDEVLMSRGFGHRDVSRGLPVTDRTLFAIGSSTKAFTAALAGALVDDGLLEWDRPVREYLPGFRMHDPVATEHLTVRDMLSHRSGLPRHDMVWYGNTALSPGDAVARLRHLQPNRSLRQVWQYNNLMYLAAGHLAAELSGCAWEDAVRQRLLDPLQMRDTNFSVHESQRSDDHSRPYAQTGGELVEMAFRDAGMIGPAGSINSCIADMTRWVAAHLNGGACGGRQVLSAQAVQELHAPAMVLPSDARAQLWPEAANVAYALGWVVMQYRGHTVLHHGGNIDGFSAMVSMLPAERIGVVVLTNLYSTGLRDVVPLMVYDELLSLAPLPWGERYHALQTATVGGVEAATAHRSAHAAAAPPSHPLQDYAGRYSHPGYGDVVVSLDGGRLVPHYNDLELSMGHVHYETWDLRLPLPDSPPLDMTFETDPQGLVSALRIRMEPTLDPILFRRLPDAELCDPAVLGQYAGAYAMGPVTMRVRLDGDALVAEVVGQGRLALTPTAPRRFAVPGAPLLAVTFVLGEDGSVASAVLDPVGVFVAEPSGRQ